MGHYLDYAATSAVRPDVVSDAVADFLRDCGATAGRGGHARSIEAGRIAYRCRRALMELLGFEGDPGRLVFASNATHALNTALWGVLGPGDVVVRSAYDHNAVRRPLHALAEARGIEVRVARGVPDGSLDLEEVERLLDGARLLVVTTASNVLGTRLPLEPLTRLAHAAGALVLVDAAQSAGHVMERPGQHADLVAFTGHKGLLGPQGTGGLWVSEGVQVAPLMCGGTGGDSATADMPDALPDRLEAGTGNSPGLAGLLVGCRFVMGEDVSEIHRKESALKERLWDGLSGISGVRVLTPRDPDGIGIVTLVAETMDPATLAARLDREHGVAVRSGLHCAPDAHALLGTLETGAVRYSLGWASTAEDVEAAVRATDAVLASRTIPVA